MKKEEVNKKNEVKNNSGSDVTILLMIILVIGLLVIGGFIILRKEIKTVNDELLRTKQVLSEYGIYIDKQTETSTAYDTSVYNVIKPSQIATESKGKKIVLWVGRQSCGYCEMYAPYINEASQNYGIKAYYVDLAELIDFTVDQPYIMDEEEFNILSSLNGEGEWKGFAEENVGGTPLTLIIQDNKVIGGLSGYADTNSVMKAFENAGLKKN